MMAAFRMLLVLTVLTGILFPLSMVGLARLCFPAKAEGSLVERDGRVVGSAMIGRYFDDPKYFWPRPSATNPFPYNAASSSGSNLGPLNADLGAAVAARKIALLRADPGNRAAIPIDLLTASGSGLDPHISRDAAYYQAPRVARIRGVPLAKLHDLIASRVEERQFAVLGEARVNVAELNRLLDGQ
ncbi:MAG: potassium-transporting ATPase subunit KdpC [Bryobacterales bacterium]|nr:potassium-transporting ATPase subunit KdpC [Bryobacterales bacterium]